MGLPIWDPRGTQLHSPYGSHVYNPYGTHVGAHMGPIWVPYRMLAGRVIIIRILYSENVKP